MSSLIQTYTASTKEVTIRLITRRDVGKFVDSTYLDEKTHMSHRVQTYTVRTLEITIRLSTRTDVGRFIDITYSDERLI